MRIRDFLFLTSLTNSVYLGKTARGELRALKVLQEKKITKGEIAAASVLDKFLFVPLFIFFLTAVSQSINSVYYQSLSNLPDG